MDADATQEDWPAVQENLRSPGFNVPKANLIRDAIGFRFDRNIVELRIVRRPQGQIGVEANLCISVHIRSKGFSKPGFRNSHCYFLIEGVSIQSYPAGDMVARSLLQLDKVVLHETCRRLDQLDLASEPAIVPPIGNQCRNCVSAALVVYFYDQRIRFVSHQICYVKIERRETALVPPNLFPVKIDIGHIVGRTEINEETCVLFSLIIKRFLVPNGAFVEKQSLALSVPISRHA